ncbi:MAG: hypothetical protein L0Z50_43265 [Verrucomicrobiales bacterium]|nr:hypothetical protein [Verrucomicrobiales bacterium]
MNLRKTVRRSGLSLLAALFFLFFAASVTPQREKLTAEQVVENHLRSFGSPEARRKAKTRVCEGNALLEILKGGFGTISGPAAYVAQDVRQALEIQFGNADYPREFLSFTGTEVQAAQVRPGQRSRLGTFLYTYPQVMKEGLFAGVYTTRWPLLDLEGRRPRLQYRGVKKVEGQKLHQLDYAIASEGTDLKVKLFFEENTFRHVRTQYAITMRHGMRTDPAQSLGASEAYARFELLETFSEFQRIDGLELPTSWGIRLTTEGDAGQEQGSRASEWEWKLKFDRIQHNLQINPELFEVE